ncbi:toprim domain-containing protein [Mucilaginibacter litoreus]|uniref:toprim domain-containing protein n=1 Tax=Mucilaginibacter litoreus TaxID=1048221 RepID=UPI0036714763
MSPLRSEGEASFKVNRHLNRWYDHGLGEGGNLIDFGLLYYNCTVRELMERFGPDFTVQQHAGISFHQPDKHPETESRIQVQTVRPLFAYPLIHYLHERHIPLSVAEQYCSEIRYELDGRNYYGIGFKNDAGGYEIRNAFFKCSSAPKDITHIGKDGSELHIFEGFFDFLSFRTLYPKEQHKDDDILVLNGAAMFERARPMMARYPVKKLWLDHDTTGEAYTKYALSLNEGFQDQSSLYSQHKDLNEWLSGKGAVPKKQMKQRLDG